MSGKVYCDLCGAEDNWSIYGKVFFFPGGAVIKVRSGDGDENDYVCRFDVCPVCLEDKLLPLMKKIPESLREQYSTRWP